MRPFDFQSPIESLDFPLLKDKGITVDIKRDDLIHPFISGNKWRKLKHILSAAQKAGKTHLVTFGGAWSNHLLATACAGAKFGFKTTGFVRGETVSNPVLSLCNLFGMELRFVDRLAYRNKPALFDHYSHGNEHVYFVDEGGHCPDGAKGCEEIISELPSVYDHLFCACGTGTTLAGLYRGCSHAGLQTMVHGIPVLAGGEFIRDAVATLVPVAHTEDIILHTDYHFGGYAKTTPPLIEFIKSFCATTGILIEPVYTGKLFYGVFDLVQSNYFKPGDRILVIHTGGLTGILGKHDQFAISTR